MNATMQAGATTPPRFEDMSREELIALQPDIHSKLRHARSALADAKRRAYRGERISPAELAALDERVDRLSGGSERIQTELSLRAAKRKKHGARLNDFFVDVARHVLPDEIYLDIVAKAEEAAQR